MKKLVFGFIWLLSFLLLMVVCDQFLLRYPGQNTPLLRDFQHFYKDVRDRVSALNFTKKEHTVKQVIAQRLKKAGAVTINGIGTDTTQQSAHYVYVDEQQTLNFADSWEDIPPALRSSAKKLDN